MTEAMLKPSVSEMKLCVAIFKCIEADSNSLFYTIEMKKLNKYINLFVISILLLICVCNDENA